MAPGRGDPLVRRLLSSLIAATVLSSYPAHAQDAGAPPERGHLPSKPLQVKTPTTADPPHQTSADPAADKPSPDVDKKPVRLIDAPAERLSPMCRAAALRLLRARRRGGALSPSEEVDLQDFRAMQLDCLDAAGATLTSGFEGAGEEALRAVAAVVAKRAQAAAFRLLQERLLSAAGCGAVDSRRFPSTCATLRSLSVEDLATSPAVLLHAVIGDFLSLAHPLAETPWMRVAILEEAVSESAARWRESGAEGVRAGLARIVRRELRSHTKRPTCDKEGGVFGEALWVSGMCLIEVQTPASFEGCDVDGWMEACGDKESTKRLLRLWALLGEAISAPGKASLADYTEIICAAAGSSVDDAKGLSDAQRRDAHAHVDAIRSVLSGLARADWIETTSGAVRSLRLITRSPVCEKDPSITACADARAAEDLFTLLAALGVSATALGPVVKEAAPPREKILESLVDRLIGRSHRDSGWGVSLGGTLSLFGGARFSGDGQFDVAFPVQLGLGLGLQSFSRAEHGFHAMFTALDLGQYVTMGEGTLTVQKPSLEASVVLGLSVGAWLGFRETPLFIAAYGGVSPFVRAGEKPTFQAGVSAGIYVPFFDF